MVVLLVISKRLNRLAQWSSLGTSGRVPFATHRSARWPRNYVHEEDARDLATNLVRRCGLDELDELEGLWCTVATVHLARELNE